MEKQQQKKITEIMKDKRIRTYRDGAWLDTLYTDKARNKVIRQTGNSYYREIEIICRSSLTHPYVMSADISKTTFLYNSCDVLLSTRRCWTQEKSRIERVNKFLQAMVSSAFSALPKGTVFCIEICSPYKVSDWIKIQNLYDPDDFFLPQKPLPAIDIDLLAMDMHAQERFSYIVIAVFTVLSRAVLSHFFC